MAALAATIAGWICERLQVPLASLMRWVEWMSVARKSSELVMFSALSVRCSPMNASWKPSLSARITVSRSSFRVSVGFRCSGCTGIMNMPSLMRPILYSGHARGARSGDPEFPRGDALFRAVRRRLPQRERRDPEEAPRVPRRQRPAGALGGARALRHLRDRVRAGVELPRHPGGLAPRPGALRAPPLRGD